MRLALTGTGCTAADVDAALADLSPTVLLGGGLARATADRLGLAYEPSQTLDGAEGLVALLTDPPHPTVADLVRTAHTDGLWVHVPGPLGADPGLWPTDARVFAGERFGLCDGDPDRDWRRAVEQTRTWWALDTTGLASYPGRAGG